MASEPATPMLPPPAPEVDLAENASVPPLGIVAATVIPTPVTVAPAPISAALVTCPTLMDTAAPTPTPLALLLPLPLPLPLLAAETSLPSATADPDVAAVEVTVTAPPVVTLVPPAIVADVLVGLRLMAS